jgi:hypothetical protein
MNPVATVVLGAALAWDAASLPWHWTQGGRSTVGEWIYQLRGGARVTSQPPVYDVLAVKEPDGAESRIRILQPYIESMDEATRLLAENPAVVCIVTYTPRQWRSGFWALTRLHESHTIVMTGGSEFTAEDRQAARRATLEAVLGSAALRDPKVARVSREDFSETRVLWGGVAHNAMAAAGAVLFGLSLAWVPAYWDAARRRRARAALWRGECPGCGYSLRGLAADVCPECGRKVKDPDAGSGS